MRTAAEPRRHLQILLFAACFLASFVYQTSFMNAAIGVYDEGIILFGARRVMDGDLIHRDFYANYGPGQFYILAALFKVFSPSILVERLWDSAIKAFSVAVICLIVARSTRSVVAALGTAAVCLVWFGSFGFYGYPVFPALAAALTGLLCLLPAFAGRRSAWSLLAGGVCVGVAFLFRYDIGIATAAVLAGLLGLHAAIQPSPGSRTVRSVARCTGLFAMGFAFVAVPVIGAFVANGAIGDLFFDVVTFPSAYYYDTRTLPFPRFSQVVSDPAAGIVYLPLVLAAAVAGMLGLARYDPRTRDSTAVAGRWAQIALIGLTLLYFIKGIVRVSPIHMSMAIVTAFVLTGIATANLGGQRGIRRAISIVVLILTAAFTVGVFADNAPEAGRNLRAIVEDAARPAAGTTIQSFQVSCGGLTGLRRLGCFPLDQDHLDALAFLRAHTRPGAYAYMGLGRHDKVFVDDVALYFLADLRSATKWHQFDPGLQTSAAIQLTMIDELKRNHPQYVVLESQWDGIQEPNASARSSGVLLLDEYIRQSFHLVARFGTISVLTRDDSQ